MKHLEDWIKEILGEIPDRMMKFPEDSKGKRNCLEDSIKENLEEIPEWKMKFQEGTRGKMKHLED